MKYEGYTIDKKLKPISTYKKPRTGSSYLKQFICLDTETSHNHNLEHPQCWIYQWAFTFNHGLYKGRTPVELVDILQEIVEFYGLNKNKKLKIFIHNLPYDFSYLAMFLCEKFGNPSFLLATSNHKPFLVEYECGLSFHCSFKLSNSSLEKWGNDLNVQHKKLVGAIDYDMIHTQTEELTDIDWKYQYNDVICMDECIRKTLEIYPQYNIATLPLTSTGFVRDELRRSYFASYFKNRTLFERSRLDVEMYDILTSQMSGGYTHGNRFCSAENVTAPEGYYIAHRDKRSYYPTTQMIELFPVGAPVWLTKEIDNVSYEDLLQYKEKYDCYVQLYIENFQLKSPTTIFPYLQLSHCYREHTEKASFIEDNGRVIQFNGGCVIVLNLLEYEIVKEQYNIETEIILKTLGFKLGRIPEFMSNVIKEHFKAKSDLKNKVKELKKNNASIEQILESELNLMKSKQILNGIYGVSATSLIKPMFTLDGNVWGQDRPVTDSELKAEKIESYFNKKSSFMRYQFGTRTTTCARIGLIRLSDYIQSLGGTPLYCDTDSLFYITNDEIEKKIEEMNADSIKKCMDIDAFVTLDNDEKIVFDAFEDEKDDIQIYRYLHAKAYAFTDSNNELHCTIAGVRKAIKEEGRTVLASEELKTIDNLKHGFIFERFGGTRAIYVDDNIHVYEGQITGGGCIIAPTTKTLSAPDYREPFEIYENEPL